MRNIAHSLLSVPVADTLKAGQKVAEDVKAAAGKKLDEAQKAGEGLKKSASGSVENLWVTQWSFVAF